MFKACDKKVKPTRIKSHTQTQTNALLHSISLVNGLGRLRSDHDAMLTLEGDSNVILLQTANYLLGWFTEKKAGRSSSVWFVRQHMCSLFSGFFSPCFPM